MHNLSGEFLRPGLGVCLSHCSGRKGLLYVFTVSLASVKVGLTVNLIQRRITREESQWGTVYSGLACGHVAGGELS